ncbi:MAG: AsmA family protein, partial [Pseudomonadota bacterium]|nr:AsmA family protein [Pseudomonadota bacterium]
MARRSIYRWLIGLGLPVVIIGAIVAVWNWDWFIPLINTRASAAIGRQVTIGHLHLRLGRVATAELDDVTVANPPGWGNAPPLARVPRLLVRVDLWRYLFHHQLGLPLIELDRPAVSVAERPDGTANFRLAMQGGSGGGPAPQIGDLRIVDGHVHAVMPKLRSDFNVAIQTREAPGRDPALLAEARGTYAGAPIVGRLTGGAVLALRDRTHPWPIRLEVADGPTRVSLDGTVQDPLKLEGANLKLRFAGPSMDKLEPLTGIPIPVTPPYELTGNLDFANHKVQFRDFAGRVGKSDLEGTIDVNPPAEAAGRPVVMADLTSRLVNLADLGGFIGTRAGGPHRPG